LLNGQFPLYILQILLEYCKYVYLNIHVLSIATAEFLEIRYQQKILAGKYKENSQVFNEDFYLPLYLPLCLYVKHTKKVFAQIFS